MRRVLAVGLLWVSVAHAEVERDGDVLIDGDPAATCRAEHAGAGMALHCPRHTRLRADRDRIELLTKIVFEYDKPVIRSGSFAVLDEVAAVLGAHPDLRVEVQGHGKEEPYRAMSLSDRRAKAVLQYLVAHGVAAERLTAHGYGDNVPLVSPSEPDAERKNRRIELVIER